MVLEVNNLKKYYGDRKALDDFTCSFTEGIYGLLGPNGAGKSTFMNILVDAIERTDGEILYDNRDIVKMGKDYRNLIGYMPQQQGVYDDFTLEEFLGYMASLKNIRKKDIENKIAEVIDFVNLEKNRKSKLKSFSGGMKQRALIAQAILNDPKILILDEPTAGLDPKERIRIRNLISQIGFDKIVIIATHVVSDIEFIANEILVMDGGKLVKKGTPEQLLQEIDNIVYEVNVTEAEVEDILSEYLITSLSKETTDVRVRVLSDKEPELPEVKRVSPTLEDLYLHIFGDR